MVRYRRNLVPGGTYFITVALEDRRSTILADNITALREAFRITRRQRPFAVDAVVVLPEHMHVLMTLPQDDADYSGRWRRIKSVFTRLVSRRIPLERNRRGDAKHGLVSRVADWPYSSFHRYFRLGTLPNDWAGDAGGPSSGFGERAE